MFRRNRKGSIIYCVEGLIFLLITLILVSTESDGSNKVITICSMGIASLGCFFVGIHKYNTEFGDKVSKYRKLFSRNKPEKIEFKVSDIRMMDKDMCYLIEFHVDKGFCMEFVKQKQCKRSQSGEFYLKVIYDRHNEFKDFEVYIDEERVSFPSFFHGII